MGLPYKKTDYMKNINKILVIGLLSMLAIACSEDKDNMLQVAKGNLVTEISLDVTDDGIILADTGDVANVKVVAKPLDAEDIGYYEYKSGDTKVFTVDSKGIVTATGPGSAILSVVAKNNANVTAKCNVLVVGTRISGIEIKEDYKNRVVTRTNTIGPTFDLSQQITILPADANVKLLKYTSSNPAVATVDENGLVTPIWEGETQIRAEATDKSGVFDICNLTVKITPVSSIAVGANYQNFSVNNLFNGANDETLPVTISKGLYSYANWITVLPYTATRNTLEYISSDPNIVSVEADASNYLVVTPKSGGTATIDINATDGYSATVQSKVTVHSVLDRTGWTIKESSPSGAVADGTDLWGGPIANLIKDNGDAAGLIKAGAPGGPAAGSDVYFVIDMAQQKTFDYFIVSGTWSGNINTGVKINNLALFGSNNGSTFDPIEGEKTISTGQYNTFIKLNASYTYRYVKVVVKNTSYGYNPSGNTYQKVTHYVIKNFRLASK